MYLMMAVSLAITLIVWFQFKWKPYARSSNRQMYWRRKPYKSLLVGLFMALFLPMIVFIGIELGTFTDTEILSGHVTNKYSKRVPCSHSYQVCSGSGKNEVCTTHYYHDYDVDWIVDSTVGKLEIDRVNWSGTKEPMRWTNVKIGEPFFKEHLYQNYIKGTEDSLFNKGEKQLSHSIPDYPFVYDYYRHTPVIDSTGTVQPDVSVYIQKLNDTYGAIKQIHLLVVVTYADEGFFNDLKEAWGGFKKNDFVLVFGLNKDGSLNWFNSSTYADGFGNRKAIEDTNTFARSQEKVDFYAVASYAISQYVRVPMEEFEHLKDEYVSPWYVYVLALLTVALSCFVVIKLED